MQKEEIILSKVTDSTINKAAGISEMKIKFPEKLAYFCGNMGNIPIMTIISGFLLIFYTDIVGLNPAAIGTLFLIARLFDAFCDPLVGYMIDHLPRTKWGRFRPWLLLGSLITAINFIILWLGPSLATSGKLTIAYISYLLIGPTFASMDISLNSLLPVMTQANQERNALSMIKSLGYVIGMAAVNIAVIPIVSMFPTLSQGWHITTVGIAVLVFLLSSIGAVGVKERITPVKAEYYTPKYLYKILFNTKPLIIMNIAVLLVFSGLMVRLGTTMYYLTYNVGNSKLMGSVSLFMLIGQIVGTIAAPMLANRFEKKHVLSISFVLSGLGAASTYLVPFQNIQLILATNAFFGLRMGGFMAVAYSIQADTIDYAEWKHQYRAEGAVASVNSFITKLGQALGGSIPAYILASSGYVANASKQSSQVLQGILLSMSVIPSLFILAGSLICLSYPITHNVYAEIAKELAARRS